MAVRRALSHDCARLRLAVVAASALFACNSVVALDAPPPIEGGSLLWVIQAADGSLSINATDGAMPSFSIRGDAEARLLQYDCSLASLRLTAGRINAIGEAATNALLPTPSRSFALTLDGTARSWTPATMDDRLVSEAIHRVALPADNLCTLYVGELEIQPVRFPITPERWTSFALSLPGEQALVGTQDGHLVRFDWASQSAEEVTPSVRDAAGNATTAPSAAAILTRAGVLWLFGEDGRVAKGSLDGGLQILPDRGPQKPRDVVENPDGTLLVTSGSYHLEPQPIPDPIAIYDRVVSSTLALDRRDERGWTNLRTARIGFLPTTPLFVATPAGWVVSGMSRSSVLGLGSSTIATDPLPRRDLMPTEIEDVLVAAPALDGGLIAGTVRREEEICLPMRRSGCFGTRGRLWRRDATGWLALPETMEMEGPIGSVFTFPDGVVFFSEVDLPYGETARLRRWHPKYTGCDPLLFDGTIERFVSIGEDKVVMVSRAGQRRQGVYLTAMHRTSHSPACLR